MSDLGRRPEKEQQQLEIGLWFEVFRTGGPTKTGQRDEEDSRYGGMREKGEC